MASGPSAVVVSRVRWSGAGVTRLLRSRHCTPPGIDGRAVGLVTRNATQHPAITTPILRLASTLSRLSLRSTPFGAQGLDRLSVEPRQGTYVMARQV
jgi:hypothetical protein